MLRIAAMVVLLLPGIASAAIYDFSVTYNGTEQSLDGGSDPMNGTVLNVGDGFVLDFHADGADYWTVQGDWSGSIYASLLVLPNASRTGSVTTTFYLDGVAVAQDIDASTSQGNVHVGAQNIDDLVIGMMFDQLIVNYALTATTGATTISGDRVWFSFTTDASLATYTNVAEPAAVPEPSTLAMFGLGGLGLAFGALRRRFRKAG
jgi:hypothetical protein